MEDVRLLKQIPIFRDFRTTELLSVSMVAKSKVYKPGELIVKEKAKGDGLYIIKRGLVKVVKQDAEEESECLIIKQVDFQNLIAGNKELERKFYKSFARVLCERLRVTNENLTFSKEINRLIQEVEKK